VSFEVGLWTFDGAWAEAEQDIKLMTYDASNRLSCDGNML
jgi:hypothetical protein